MAVSMAVARPEPFSFGRKRGLHAHERRQSTNVTWPHQTFVSEPTFLPPIPEIEKLKETAPGYMFLAQLGEGGAQQAAMIMKEDGELVWQSDPSIPLPVNNFLPQTLNGKPVLVDIMAIGPPIIASGGVVYGMVQILDDTYTLLHNISVTDPDFTYAPGNWTSILDAHESFITKRNTLLVPAYNITQWDLSPVGGPENGYLMDSMLYEVSIPEGNIIYKWRSSDAIPITDSNVELGPLYGWGNETAQAWDYFHINSIQDWGEDGYVLSGRNTFDILFVNSTTDSIQWQFRGSDGGDFEIAEPDQFRYQHFARLHEVDGELLLSMFDNKNDIQPPYDPSEGHIHALDLEAMTAERRTVYIDSNDNVAAQSAGSMQIDFTKDRFALVGYGSQPIAKEYDLDGSLRMSWRFGPADPSGGPSSVLSYRTVKSTWKGYPATLPSVKACRTSTGADVFVSWNGATEVTGWTVYAGETENDMVKGKTEAKTGFETKICLEEEVAMVKVQANGKRLDRRFVAESSIAVAVEEC
ncbi:hypothetical protein EJ04DRAFT_569184 [Polyplosphaeria fusca]|uniref:ASST-domain-containing protein n=1 Tax=Polyplosphaeria fusca TaxID=682080 RepID=A0A9P4QNF8_9PLEO|nr:hypothetical protein EJ04DRAFT_569184 [Polyplosphaeria fusca]